MTQHELIDKKESALFKKYLMQSSDQKAYEIVKGFERKGSLYVLRSTLRGHIGLPPIRKADKNGSPTFPQRLEKEEIMVAPKPYNAVV